MAHAERNGDDHKRQPRHEIGQHNKSPAKPNNGGDAPAARDPNTATSVVALTPPRHSQGRKTDNAAQGAGCHAFPTIQPSMVTTLAPFHTTTR